MSGLHDEGALGVDLRFARSARRWLAAYPRDWRDARTGEMTSLLADLAPPGAHRVGVRAGMPLLWSGLATRRRARPPLHVVLGYRLFNRPVPARYRPWVRADLEAPWRPLRELPWSLTGLAPLLAFMGAGLDSGAEAVALVAYVLALAAAECGRDSRHRRMLAERHLLPGVGEDVGAGGVRRAVVLRDRVRALPAAGAAVRAVAVLGTGSGGLLAVVAAQGDLEVGTAVAAGVALAVGGALALGTRHRRWLLDDPPEQPGRRVVAATPGALLAGPLAAAAAVALAVALYLGADAHGAAATVLLAGALVAAPVVVVTRRWLTAHRQLVAVDVVRALADGLPPALDLPRPGLLLVEAPSAPSARPAPSP
ncbi:hypothetical protein [Cellulomonas shaoxiangyii]|uniref:Uncharacterized protein n=1 Tax=Cellulomonas shaoxiangyii TaxID=2566013 RepID=A0A4P7SGK2_9CELL|nr:hypothetical protein [Cellulomonas shaoxiangyii]QCB92617.1 hypothetical protein E5225_02665 [Cellulomonas shaoxiangyii]TGY85227.1 hypothetical protein E5226_07390 [Cellulomonas shaoxiangyii]